MENTPENVPVQGLRRLKAENEYPLFPSAIYCSEELWQECIARPGRDQALHENERTDSLLTSMAAAIDKALAGSRGDFSQITFKHWFWGPRPKARKRAQLRLTAYLRRLPHSHKPWMLLAHPDWLPETLQ